MIPGFTLRRTNPMISHKILRAGIFILAFLLGLLRESIAHGHSPLPSAHKVAPGFAFGEIHPR
jgi:hypothetical protein